jgi:hypothetical protein
MDSELPLLIEKTGALKFEFGIRSIGFGIVRDADFRQTSL